MNLTYRHIIITFLLLAGGFIFPRLGHTQTTWSELTVIGNKIGQTEMKAQQARNVFRAQTTTWSNKTTITIALPSPKSGTAEPVARLIYGTKVTTMQKFWLSLVFQGRASPPNFFDSDQELIQFVQKTPGAIGVVSENAPIPSNVSVITIQQ